ncbi:MAG: D-sedoheptulose-7-phosphate isomerase [Planctomycetota bacterium]|jgi:D-sedoheptulose 7-phosphate isomerase
MDHNTKRQIESTIRAHAKLIDVLKASGVETIAAAAQALIEALRRNAKVYICGNGGSAADAQHIASELVGRFERERNALPALALTTDTSVLTSISNDYGYENVFTRQLEAFIKEGDILWAISTSGTSSNVIAAVELAKNKGACVLAFTGLAESKLEELADICFCAGGDSTARNQEVHQLAYHMICDLVEQGMCE